MHTRRSWRSDIDNATSTMPLPTFSQLVHCNVSILTFSMYSREGARGLPICLRLGDSRGQVRVVHAAAEWNNYLFDTSV